MQAETETDIGANVALRVPRKKENVPDPSLLAAPPHTVVTPLWSHQRECLRDMIAKEYDIFTKRRNLGLLCADIGAGKTLTVLALIANSPTVQINYCPLLNECTPLPVCLQNIVQRLTESDFKELSAASADRSTAPLLVYGPADARIIRANLIVVPFYLFRQWRAEITTRTTLKCAYVNSIQDRPDRQVFEQCDVVLCNSNKYNALARYCESENIRWQRVIYDEVHAVDLPRCRCMLSVFYWGITTTFTALQNVKNLGFVRCLFRHLQLDDLNAIAVKTTPDQLDSHCLDFVPYTKYVIECRSTAEKLIVNECFPMTALSDLVNEDSDEQAHKYLTDSLWRNDSVPDEHKNFRGALKHMSLLELQMVNISTNQTLSEYSKNERLFLLGRSIYRHRICCHCTRVLADGAADSAPSFRLSCCMLPFCERCVALVTICPYCVNEVASNPSTMFFMENLTPPNREGAEFFLKYKGRYQECERLQKLVHPRARMALPPPSSISYGSSWIAGGGSHDLTTMPTSAWTGSASVSMIPQSFQLQPVKRISNDSKRRKQLSETKILSHTAEYIAGICAFIAPRTLDKFEACDRILRQCRNDRNLIFINCSQTALRLRHMLNDLKIKYSELKGAAAVVMKRIQEFGDYQLNVLILNGQHLGNGLNIQCADNMIIFHTPNQQLLLQLIGRRQRPHCSKTRSLKVFELQYHTDSRGTPVT